MIPLNGEVDNSSTEYNENKTKYQELIKDLDERVDKSKKGGGEKACARHVKRGKLMARKRVEAIIDPGSPFLELSSLAASFEKKHYQFL